MVVAAGGSLVASWSLLFMQIGSGGSSLGGGDSWIFYVLVDSLLIGVRDFLVVGSGGGGNLGGNA